MSMSSRLLRCCIMPVALMAASVAHAEIQTRVVEYRQGGALLEGYLAWDTAGPAQKPGVLIVHEWTGLGPYVKARAEKLAKLGYVAFAAEFGREVARVTASTVAEATEKLERELP